MENAGTPGENQNYLLEVLQGIISLFDVFGVLSRTRTVHIWKCPFEDVQAAFHNDLNTITLDLKEVMGTYNNHDEFK